LHRGSRAAIGIVALARGVGRPLAYLEKGEIPEGACLKSSGLPDPG